MNRINFKGAYQYIDVDIKLEYSKMIFWRNKADTVMRIHIRSDNTVVNYLDMTGRNHDNSPEVLYTINHIYSALCLPSSALLICIVLFLF